MFMEIEDYSFHIFGYFYRNPSDFRYRRIRDDSESFVNKYLAQSRSAMPENGTKPSASTPAVNQSEAPTASSSTTKTTATTPTSTWKISDESQYPSGRSRYAALKERKSRVARSKSSAVLGTDQSPGTLIIHFNSNFRNKELF